MQRFLNKMFKRMKKNKRTKKCNQPDLYFIKSLLFLQLVNNQEKDFLVPRSQYINIYRSDSYIYRAVQFFR